MKQIISKGITTLQEDGPIEFSKKSASFIKYNSLRKIENSLFNVRYGSGSSILEKDWDNLLLLDACRYDEFCRIAPYKNIVEKRITLESQTPDFLRSTFNNDSYHDIVYVTANPQTLKFQYELDKEEYIFHDIVSLVDEWDEERQTIEPDKVRHAAVKTANEYPNKKLLIHFMQPHPPFLGATAESIHGRTGKTIDGLNLGHYSEYVDMDAKDIEDIHSVTYQEILEEGIEREEIRRAYQETLKIVVNECHHLQESLQGKTALTSDHGELLGERQYPFGSRRWRHPGNTRTKELCVVPYLEFDCKRRKEIKSEPPAEDKSINEEIVDKRLRSLGYKTE